jgi:hypothetical protein
MRFLKLILIVVIISNSYTQVNFESSNLPIIIINTNGQDIPNSFKILADMGIIFNGPGQRNYITDALNNYNGKIGIELRGSSSLNFPKKQYALETRDEVGNNLNVSLIGLPQENDWVLYAPYSDKSLVRNVLLYHLSNKIGRYASRSRFCELIINGNYRGIYVLLEKIKRDQNRVNISELNPDEISGCDLTGGYIIKIDKTDGEEIDGWYSEYKPVLGSSSQIYYQYHYPRPDGIVPEQKAYIKNYFDAFEDMMYGWDYDNPVSGYPSIIELRSFVDFFLLNELSKNVDGYRLSTFYYKDKDSEDSLLHIGPVWDFNLAFGNADYYDGWKTDAWQVEINSLSEFKYDGAKIPFYWERLMNDQYFLSQIVMRWSELRLNIFSVDSINSHIDKTVLFMDEAQQRNFDCWPILGEYVWPNYYVGGSYQDEIIYLKNWIKERIDWMDMMLCDTVPPDTINNLYIRNTTNSSITVAWDTGNDNNKISGYDIFLNGEKVRYSNSFYCTIDRLYDSNEYQIEVKARDYAGNYSIGNAVVTVSLTDLDKNDKPQLQEFQLYQNYPNPFNPFTKIKIDIPKYGYVHLTVYNNIGQKITNLVLDYLEPGSYTYYWNASNYPSGIYYCKLISNSYKKSIKMIVMK